MPAFFTHETVCEKVLDRLPEKQAARISDRALFYLGAQGGDPLFLYRDKNKRLGVVLHREKIYEFFAALLRADCDSFALGYLTHYAADTVFHPYVYRYVREHGEEYPKHNLHALIERDIDYFLLAAANADPRRHSYPTKPGGDGLKTLYTALSPAIRSVYGISVDYKKFARAYRAYFRYQKLLQDRSGMLRPLVRGAEAVFFAPHTLSDLMLRRTPEIRFSNCQRDEGESTVYDLEEESAVKSLKLIRLFTAAKDKGEPLPEKLFSESFNKGKES